MVEVMNMQISMKAGKKGAIALAYFPFKTKARSEMAAYKK